MDKKKLAELEKLYKQTQQGKIASGAIFRIEMMHYADEFLKAMKWYLKQEEQK